MSYAWHERDDELAENAEWMVVRYPVRIPTRKPGIFRSYTNLGLAILIGCACFAAAYLLWIEVHYR